MAASATPAQVDGMQQVAHFWAHKLHNVQPDHFFGQLVQLNRHFSIVSGDLPHFT